MNIRPMTEADIDAVESLEKRAFSVPWSREDFESCVSSPLRHYLVVEDGKGRLAAYGGFQQVFDTADIENIAVEEDLRRRGIARALFAALLEEGGKNGVRHFFLEVRDSNLPAIRLYESFGFIKIAVRKDYYRNPREDARIYTLQLL